MTIALCASGATATVFDYQVNPTYSAITMTASCADLGIVPGTTSLGGSLQADVTDSSIRFTGGSATANNNLGGWFSYACTAWLIGAEVAFNNLSLQLSSAAIPVVDGAFVSSDTTVGAGGTMDSHGTGLLGWLIGSNSAPLSPVDNSTSGNGRIITEGNIQRVLVPINASFDAPLPNPVIEPWKLVHVQLTGWIVAERQVPITPDDGGRPQPPDVPEPTTTLLLLAGGGVALLTRRR